MSYPALRRFSTSQYSALRVSFTFMCHPSTDDSKPFVYDTPPPLTLTLSTTNAPHVDGSFPSASSNERSDSTRNLTVYVPPVPVSAERNGVSDMFAVPVEVPV